MRPSILCAVANAITVLGAAFIFLFYIFHETKGSEAKEMNSEEIEQFRHHHRRLLPASEHFTNISLIEEHYCPSQQYEQCAMKAFSYCGNSTRTASLTFDVDQRWTKKYTERVIEELKSAQIPATFFLSGKESRDHQDKCEQIQTLIRAGHQVQITNWDDTELQSDQPIEALHIDEAMQFFRNCLGNKASEPVQFRPSRGQITLEQARAVSQRYHVAIAMWSLSCDPDRAEHLMELAESHFERGESVLIRLQDPEYWAQPGPISELVSHFLQHNYKFVNSKRCYQQCFSPVCLAPPPSA